MNEMERMEDYRNYRGNYRDDYRTDYRDDYGRNRRNYRYYRDYRDYSNYRNYRDEYAMMLEEIAEDGMELSRAYEDVSEMASNVNEKQKLMKLAQREKEQYKMVKEMLENHM